jgi:hypothetical protein
MEALENYNHIELSEEEQAEAILWRKQRKETELQKTAENGEASGNEQKGFNSATVEHGSNKRIHAIQGKPNL